MRGWFLVFLLSGVALGAEPPRWASGTGTVGGLTATHGQDIPLPATLVAGPLGGRVELGDTVDGELLLGPGATAVLSLDEGLLINLNGSAQITRTDTATAKRLTLRLRPGEVVLAPGVVVAEDGPHGAVAVAVRGQHRTRTTDPTRPRAAWIDLPEGTAVRLGDDEARLQAVGRRPQISDATVLDQVSGRALPSGSGIDGLDEAARDDLALSLLRGGVADQPLSAFRQLRFLAATNAPLALVGLQVVVAAHPGRAHEALTLALDGGLPVEHAAAAAAFAAPDQAAALAQLAVLRQPAKRSAILRVVAAAAPAQAATVNAIP